jgi:hypothetical protein
MFLREIFANGLQIIKEGGNLSSDSPSWTGEPDHQADEIDLKVNNRSNMVNVIDQLLHSINDAFAKTNKVGIWNPELLASRQFLGGSSLHFFDTNGISDEEFTALKPKVGDIDTQVDKQLEKQVHSFLSANIGKIIGNSTLLGFGQGNEQYNALFQLTDLPVKLQIDFEFGKYDETTGTPDEWFRFSHSSDWADVQVGVKGVFHKYLYRSLSGLSVRQFYIAKLAGRGKNRAIQIDDTPVADSTISFAVASGQGGGVSEKYTSYIDPTTDQPMMKDGLPVLTPVAPSDRTYIQNLAKQFQLLFGVAPTAEDSRLQQSFVGTLDLINKYVDPSKKPDILEKFLSICFEVGSQMITKGDPARDAQTKFIAIDLLLEKLELGNMRTRAVEMAKAYEDDFNEVEAYKQANPNERQPRAALRKAKALQQLAEAEQTMVKAQLRKGMPHLHDLKPADLLDLLDELHDGNGNFKLQNIPLNVKVDGFGGRFGKNADGIPFMGTSRTEPRYEAGFLKYHQQKGTQDPEILGRAKLFDNLFTEMMNAISLIDNKFGPDFLVNKQVTCEVLYLPFATETPEGKLKFVGIHYDKLPQGIQLALVPFRVTAADTGDDLPNSNKFIKQLTSAGQQGSVMFIDNSLTQKKALDVTAIVPPLANIEQFKSMLASKKRDQAAQVKAALEPVKAALETAIIKDPNIIGKDLLGKDYEGIVINSRLGPIKVTSQEQRQVISDKNAAKTNARTERPRGNAKTAVVAVGSFVGHRGHEQLWNHTVDMAKSVGGDPYLFIGNAEGAADPIPPSVKVQTWHKLYPAYAKNISTVIQGGSLIQKIKHELINPLPGRPPRYDHIVIAVGKDREHMANQMAAALMKAVNKFQGYQHVRVTPEITERSAETGGTGISFTNLRNILKDPNASEHQQLTAWSHGFDAKKLGVDWIKHLMDITRKGMGIQAPVAPHHTNSPEIGEDAAGVGIITKQNTTADVNSSTPKKNLKAFNLIKEANKVLREMRANEFIKEGKSTDRHPDHDAVSQGTSRTRDIGGYDRVYHMNRLMMAMAMADGESTSAVDSPADTWFEKYNTHHPYTKQEDNMVRAAMKTVPTDGKHVSKFGKSKEPSDINVTSTVAKSKKNQYGI